MQHASGYPWNMTHVGLKGHYILGILKKEEIMKIYDDKKFIGNIIRNARKNSKLSQAELSEKLEMSEKNLGNIENGKQFPQINNLFRIIEELNLCLEDFGVSNYKTTPGIRKELLQDIYLSSQSEIEVYNEILQSLKKLNKN